MSISVEGCDLHQHVGRRILIEGTLAQLRWADPENNGLLLRVRTAERGREYLVRESTYTVSDEREPVIRDDVTDRWDNEPSPHEDRRDGDTLPADDLVWCQGADPGEQSPCALNAHHPGHYISATDLRVSTT